MEELVLRKPTMADEHMVLAYRDAMTATHSEMHGTSMLETMPSVAQWLDKLHNLENPQTVPAGLVTGEQFIYVRPSDGQLVGMINLRHSLNDYLLRYGGHIGYSVHPAERRKGYATSMLSATLRHGCTLGLPKVLITCAEHNEASRRTILAGGGVLENKVFEEAKQVYYERYWITLV